MILRLPPALPALLLLVLMAGCPPASSRPCDTDADCPDGRCRFGACRPLCEEDLDCGSRQLCQQGACVPRPECSATSDCARGFECAAGECRCTSSDACALNQSCLEGRCRTPPPCTSTADCQVPGRCEVTQGLCLPPCTLAADCAPSLDPLLAGALYQCIQGTCTRRCVNDASCGMGFLCRSGQCERAECAQFSDCPEGRYCTSATSGRCQPYELCADASSCPSNHECRPFSTWECPPGFPCNLALCRELPLCLVDPDCRGDAYCQQGHCQPSSACEGDSGCAADQACVGRVCVPGGCRGHPDCAPGQACVGESCRSAPPPSHVSRLELTPQRAHLAVGGTTTFRLVAFELDGSSFPLLAASFEVLDAAGQPSPVAQVSADGTVLGLSGGSARIRVGLAGAAVAQVEAVVHVYPALESGRRVVVVDAQTLAPLAQVAVAGCEDPPPEGPCPAPVETATTADGVATFPFSSSRASFSIASAQQREDGLPRYEILSLADTDAKDLLIPLGHNPVRAAAGFNGLISFAQVRTQGTYWLGWAALSTGDPAEADLQQLLGETFFVNLPGLSQPFPLPGSAVLYTSPLPGFANPIKDRSFGLGQPGRRSAIAFAGRTDSAQVLTARSAGLLAYTGAMDYAIVPFHHFGQRPLVPDALDVDGDGRCADAQKCPQGPQWVPDYFNFTPLTFHPRHEQRRRTEVVLPDLPAGLDSAVVAAVQVDGEAGLLPLGLTSAAGGLPRADGTRSVEPLLLRSGGALFGSEVGLPGIWAVALQASSPGGSQSGRVQKGQTLPTTAALAPFLPLPSGSSYQLGPRAFFPGQPAWNAAASMGAELARVDLYGTVVRHRIYFAATGSQTRVQLPQAPSVVSSDPASLPGSRLRVTLLGLAAGAGARQALELGGPSLCHPAELIEAYARWESQ